MNLLDTYTTPICSKEDFRNRTASKINNQGKSTSKRKTKFR